MQTNANAQHDLDTLTALNRDYFVSVQKGDVKRFEIALRIHVRLHGYLLRSSAFSSSVTK